jgi:hypothetical protein
VPQEDKAPTVDRAPNPNGWVMAAHRTAHSTCPVAHRTVRCVHRQQPPQWLPWWLRAINTPQPPQLQAPRFLKITFNTRALAFTPRHNSNDQSLSKSQIHLKHLVTCEREILCSFELLLLGLPFFLSHSCSQVTCNQSKRHLSVCWSLRGLCDPFD